MARGPLTVGEQGIKAPRGSRLARDPTIRDAFGASRERAGWYGSPLGGPWVFRMSTRWENVVTLAREIDAAVAAGRPPDGAIIARLARAVIDFQRELSGSGSVIRQVPPKD